MSKKNCYREANVMQSVKEYVVFYTNVFCHVFEDKCKSQLMKLYKDKICNLPLSAQNGKIVKTVKK